MGVLDLWGFIWEKRNEYEGFGVEQDMTLMVYVDRRVIGVVGVIQTDLRAVMGMAFFILGLCMGIIWNLLEIVIIVGIGVVFMWF